MPGFAPANQQQMTQHSLAPLLAEAIRSQQAGQQTLRQWGQQMQDPASILAMLATKGATAPDIAPVAAKVFKQIGKLKQPLERVTTYLEPLAQHTDRLYRETNLESLLDLVGNRFRDMVYDDVYLSNSVNMARGQGMNKGVMVEFDPSDLKGALNLSKPGLQQAYQHGEAEFVARYNNQDSYRKAVRSVLIHPQAQADRAIVRNIRDWVLPGLERAGWQKTVLEDGSILLKKPDAPARP